MADFVEGNKLIEDAIEKFLVDYSDKSQIAVLEAIRQRMHQDGQFIIPIAVDENNEDRFSFQTVQTRTGEKWSAAFTSVEEFKKGGPTKFVPFFIDKALELCLGFDTEGFVINPFGKSFTLPKDLIKLIFALDGDVEYRVPDEPITAELLEDGSFLKRAVEICNRNRTELNVIKLFRILRDSNVWVPCNAILSDADYEKWTEIVKAADEKGDLGSIVGQQVTNQDNIRMVPDILQSGDKFYFPVFSSAEEMGEYGERFSKVGSHFLRAMNLARNNDRDVEGIVINAFSEPFEVPKTLFDMIAGMESQIEGKE